MKKVNRKRLNNKGFTLIELLAVVVILAVVMGIAMTSVLSAMNKSRGGSLADTAMVVANAFNQKYTESLVDGVPTSVYKNTTFTTGYDFSDSAIYYIDKSLVNEFNISADSYALEGSSATAISASTSDVVNSFVSFDATIGKFVVCMVANKTGSYYVANYSVGGTEADATSTSITLNGKTLTFATKEMFACSDGTQSW